MRKFQYLFLFVCTIFFTCNPVYANTLDEEIDTFMNQPTPGYNEINEMNNGNVINEFDVITKLENESIKNRSFSLDKEEYENGVLKFKEEISLLSKMSKNELSKMNFNERQINAIKSTEGLRAVDIKNDVARAAAANFSFSISKNRFERNNYAVFNAFWAWQSAPIWNGRDTLVFAWNDGFMVDRNRTTMKVTYRDIDGNYKGESRYASTGLIQGCRFDFEQSFAPGGLRALSSGKAYVVVDNTSHKNAVEIVGEYFHNYNGINISVNIGRDLGISISPSDKSRSMGSDYIRMN